MNTAPHLRQHLTGNAAGKTAREQVTGVVRALSRARWKQIFFDLASTAVFVAVLASIISVVVIRIGWLSLSPWLAVAGLLMLALTTAAAAACFRRPDALDVAIAADLQLNLKQRLSTAWEFMNNDEQHRAINTDDAAKGAVNDDADTIGQLASQAVRARLPARSRAGQVFALRANTHAMMTPVAVIALILVSIVDVDVFKRAPNTETDEMVISEGVRLRDYGRRMQARARQRDLPRSDEQSRRVQELGSRMQSGALSRAEALSRLRDLDDDLDTERRDALSQGEQTDVGPLRTQTMSGGEQRRGMSAQDLLQQILDGRLKADGTSSQILSSDRSALSRSGISSEDIRDALKRFEAGDRKALEDIMEKMSQTNQALRDANELDKAREQVARARESLGDKNARPSDDESSSTGVAKNASNGTPGDAERGLSAAIEEDGGKDGSSMPGGLGKGSPRERDRRAANAAAGGDEKGPQLKAEVEIREGGVFVSEARVQPRLGNAGIENTQIDARYTQQLEQVLSNEQYPLHYKEFIRRYFLNLSEGVRRPQAGQQPKQAAQ